MKFIKNNGYICNSTTDNNELVERLNKLVHWLYDREVSGGAFHIVLDDDNYEDENILWCLNQVQLSKEIEDHIKRVYYKIGGILLGMNLRERIEWAGLDWDYWNNPG